MKVKDIMLIEKYSKTYAPLTTLLTVLLMVTAPPQAANAAPQVSDATQTNNLNANSIDKMIAVVNDQPILQSDLQMAMDNTKKRLAKLGQPIPSEADLQHQVLDKLIMRDVQLSLVKRLGLYIDDATLNNTLTKIAQDQGAPSLAAFQMALEQKQPGSYQLLRQQLREDLSINQLKQQQVDRRVQVSDRDIDLYLASPESAQLNTEEYHTLHVRVPYVSKSPQDVKLAMQVAQQLANILTTANITVEEAIASIKPAYPLSILGGDMGFHPAKALPAAYKSTITSLAVGQVTKPMASPEGVNVIKLLAIKNDAQQIVHQWQVKHILLVPTAIKSEQLVKQQINDIYEQLRQGADFATLASTYSDDPGSAGKGGDLDWVSTGQMVPEFEEVMKNTVKGDFSTPFVSRYGYHILKIDNERDQDVSKDYKRAIARNILAERMAKQALEDWLREIRAQAYVKVLDDRFSYMNL